MAPAICPSPRPDGSSPACLQRHPLNGSWVCQVEGGDPSGRMGLLARERCGRPYGCFEIGNPVGVWGGEGRGCQHRVREANCARMANYAKPTRCGAVCLGSLSMQRCEGHVWPTAPQGGEMSTCWLHFRATPGSGATPEPGNSGGGERAMNSRLPGGTAHAFLRLTRGLPRRVGRRRADPTSSQWGVMPKPLM